MRHTITRTIIAVIWFIAAVAGLFTANYMMTAVGLIAGPNFFKNLKKISFK